MPTIVYALCAFASLICALLLVRGYLKSRTRLLFWGALCFVFLTATNILLFVDLVVYPAEISLLPWRHGTTLTGLLLFIYGLVFESESTPRRP